MQNHYQVLKLIFKKLQEKERDKQHHEDQLMRGNHNNNNHIDISSFRKPSLKDYTAPGPLPSAPAQVIMPYCNRDLVNAVVSSN